MEIGKVVSRKGGSSAYNETLGYVTEEEMRILQDLAQHSERTKKRLFK